MERDLGTEGTGRTNAALVVVMLILGGACAPCCCCGALEGADEDDDSAITEASESSYIEPTEPPELSYPDVPTCSEPSSARRQNVKGSAKDLTGTQLSVIVFVNVEGTAPWTNAEMNGMTGAVDDAHRWLEGEAARYGATLKMKRLTLDVLDVGPTDAFDHTVRTDGPLKEITRLATEPLEQGHTDRTWVDALERTHGADGSHMILFPNVGGRAFAKYYIPGSRHWLDPSVVHLTERGRPRVELSVIAHEILHNYAAIDLYSEFGPLKSLVATLNGKMRDEVARKWPESIMLTSGRNVHRIDRYLDPLNAWLIGWTPCVDEPFYRKVLDNKEAW